MQVSMYITIYSCLSNNRSERALAGPTLCGTVKSFCRQQGHGFIIPRDGGEPLFVHISEYVFFINSLCNNSDVYSLYFI